MNDNLTPGDVTRIRNEAARLLASENPDELHNKVLHQQIVTAWKMYHKAMWQDLQRLGIGESFAVVQQQRMWEERERLIESGMQVTEATQIAECEHLMLAPDG